LRIVVWDDALPQTKGFQNMKKYSSIMQILTVPWACLILIGCQTNQPGAATAPPPNSGHVLVYRVANFGSGLSLVVNVDGKDMGSFSEGVNYSGYLPAGQHVITVRAEPTDPNRRPGRKTLTVVAGKTYLYTAAWSGGKLILVPGH
jgi:hypothetical protein